MIKRIKQFLLLVLFIYLPYASMAWSMTGHRVVGEIAQSYLTAKARLAIKQILGNESLAMSANWADFIKSDPAYNYLNNWHYANFKDGFTEADMAAKLATDTMTNAYTKINFLIKQLKNKALDKQKKIMYLRLLVHIVGDVHQPMHLGREEDLGGNRIKVMWFYQPANLHSVWDDKLIDEQKLSFTEYARAINFTTKAQRAKLIKQPITHWFYESYAIAQTLYAEIKEPDQKLSYRYSFDHIKTVNEQLLKGGVHLAGLLNQIYG